MSIIFLSTGVRFWVVRGETVFDDDAYPVPNELGSYVNITVFFFIFLSALFCTDNLANLHVSYKIATFSIQL